MKLWKWIVGLLAMLGGAAAVAATQKKKVTTAKKQVKNTANAKQTTQNFKKKYRGRSKK